MIGGHVVSTGLCHCLTGKGRALGCLRLVVRLGLNVLGLILDVPRRDGHNGRDKLMHPPATGAHLLGESYNGTSKHEQR